MENINSSIPSIAADAVLVKSEKLDDSHSTIHGYDFNEGLDYAKLMQSYSRMGFQGSNLGKCIAEINRMVSRER